MPGRPTFVAGAFIVLVAGSVFAGWALDIPIAAALMPGWRVMVPSTAASFVLLGVLLMLRSRNASAWIVRTLAALLLVAPVITVIEYITGARAGVES